MRDDDVGQENKKGKEMKRKIERREKGRAGKEKG